MKETSIQVYTPVVHVTEHLLPKSHETQHNKNISRKKRQRKQVPFSEHSVNLEALPPVNWYRTKLGMTSFQHSTKQSMYCTIHCKMVLDNTKFVNDLL